MNLARNNLSMRSTRTESKVIIFYTLPLALGDRPTLFSSVIDDYLPLANKFLEAGFECTFVGTDELVSQSFDFQHDWVSPSTYACKYPSSQDRLWIEQWRSLLKSKPLSFHDEFIKYLIDDICPDLLFCWGYDGRLDFACKSRCIPIIFNEFGLLQAPNLTTYFSNSFGPNSQGNFRSGFIDYQKRLDGTTENERNIELKQLEMIYNNKSAENANLALILLQADEDSNILFDSPFSNMFDYVECIFSVLNGSSLDIVVKPAPTNGSISLPKNAQIASDDESVADLISKAQVIFTINSAAGYEAAIAGKCVYVLGDAVYGGLGLTIDANRPCALQELWHTHGTRVPSSQKLRAQALAFSLSHYFLSPSQFHEPSAHIARLSSVDSARLSSALDESMLFTTQAVDRVHEAGSARKYIARLDRRIQKAQALVSKVRKELRDSECLFRSELEYYKKNTEELNIQLRSLRNNLFSVYNSNSWQLTSPFRTARRALRNSLWQMRSLMGKFKLAFRKVYQTFPFLVKLRLTAMRWKVILLGVFSGLVNSRSNIRAISFLTLRRFNHKLCLPDERFQPSIDISIVTHNSEKWIDSFFSSLCDQKYPIKKLRIYVVDNASIDQTVEKLLSWKARLTGAVDRFTIIESANVGFGCGHDKAIRLSTADFILITNIDIIFTNDAITNVVAAAGCDGSNLVASWEFRQVPYEHPKYYDPVTLETNWSSHACVLLRRSAYMQSGGYEPEIFMYGEDVELSYRLRSYGYQLKYCPSAVVKHFTYEYENQVKPLQFSGSTLANAYIRLRFGQIHDKLSIVLLQWSILFRPAVYPGSKRDIGKNISKIFRNLRHFSSGKGLSREVFFPFRGFDYEMARDGAFWKVDEPISEQPLVTIITRTYKGRSEFLRQAILSVVNQTYNNIELIVVEDGGETMMQLVDEFALVENRQIRFYGMDKVGRSVTGNHGLELANGKYCMFLDDDDLLFADHVEVLSKELERNVDAVAAYSLAIEVQTDTSTNGRYTELSFETPQIFKQNFSYETLLDHNFIPIQSLLFKRSLYLQRGGFETDMSDLEDWNLWLRYGAGNKFLYVPKTTSLFRTPADPAIRMDRHKSLHKAYFQAKNRALISAKRYLHSGQD